MDDSIQLPKPFPLSRYVYYGEFQFYYAYGNTPPDDYLENVTNEREPVILLLGCGDLRSCMYTVWRNFDATVSRRFDGAHFVLNDKSAAILARNVLFLYLCLKVPREKHLVMGWVCAVWAIWFCHELLPEHEAILNSALAFLIKCAGSKQDWSSSSNPLSSLVKFTSAQVLSEISQVWRMWYEKDIRGVNSVDAMNSARKAEHNRVGIQMDIESGMVAIGLVTAALGVIKVSDTTEETKKKMEREVNFYLKSGSIFVERMLNGISSLPKRTSVNYTFYERKDGLYTMHYASVPFRCFFHSFLFSAQKLKKSSSKVPKPILDSLLIENKNFENYPFLANSVQQFSIWLLSFSKVLSQRNVSFTIQYSDAIEFCLELQSPLHAPHLDVECIFDLIYTSNLIDHLAAPNLVLSAIPLLKPNGHLFTMTLLYKGIGSTAEEYLKKCFGFESKLLPVLFGVRCINHEGSNYASHVSAQLIPWEFGNTGLTQQWPKLLIWERVGMQPQKVNAMDRDSAITKALFHSIRLFSSSLFVQHQGSRTINHLCTETAIKVLQMYAAVLEADVSDHQFWSPLCSCLIQDKFITPLYHALQTHCMLHGLHLHLTVNDLTCPICRGEHISQHIGLFSVELSLPFRVVTPNFMAFVHKSGFNPLQFCSQSNMGTDMDVYVSDCLTGQQEKNKLKLEFYFPSSFAAEGYNVSLLSFMVGGIGPRGEEMEINIPSVLSTQSLASCRVPGITHYFQATESPPPSQPSNFSSIISHSSTDGDYFETVLQLNDKVLSNLESGTGVTTKQISSSEVEICCGSLSHKIHYPHPIEYNRLAVKISRKKKNVTILAARAAHNFEEERALFLVDPENLLTLLPANIGEDAMISFCGMMFTKQDRDILQTCRRETELMPPMVNLKESLNVLFQVLDEFFFHIILPVGGVHALVVVQNRVFDIQRKTPAIDLAFCCLEESFVHDVAPKWQGITPSTVRGIKATEAEYELFKKVFKLFAQRTFGKVRNTKGRFQLLEKQHIDRYFTRAVVYPLYTDPDTYVRDMDFTIGKLRETTLKAQPPKNSSTTADKSIHPKCSYCGTQSSTLKKCANCGKVQYCDPMCQKKHWKKHKSSCKTSTNCENPHQKVFNTTSKPTDVFQKCSYCGNQSQNLKRCVSCGKVYYCNRECQKKHWKEHKPNCHRASDPEPTVTSSKEDDEDKQEPPFRCDCCKGVFPSLKRCPCHQVAYCSTTCQRKDWSNHKTICTAKNKTLMH